MTLPEVVKYLKVRPSMIHRLVRLKAFSTFKIGSLWRFNLEEIDAWLLELSGKVDCVVKRPSNDQAMKRRVAKAKGKVKPTKGEAPQSAPIAAADGIQLFRKWTLLLKVICREVRSLLMSSKVFWEVQRILEDNEKALSHGLFNNWMATNYGVSTAIGIRRQLDRDARSVSLKGLLSDILKGVARNPDLLSRSTFLLNYRPELRDLAQSEFDKLVGSGEARVQTTYVLKDLDRLAAVTNGVHRYTDKRIAHRDLREGEKRKLGELDECLQLVAEITDRYGRLITGYRTGACPELPPGWKAVFEVAWIKETPPT
jgi:excisionase family DNA binding protein